MNGTDLVLDFAEGEEITLRVVEEEDQVICGLGGAGKLKASNTNPALSMGTWCHFYDSTVESQSRNRNRTLETWPWFDGEPNAE